MKPKHIAIIMDGNRRWAKSNNYSLLEAYEKGLETLNDTVNNFIKLKIKYLTVFGFSTENWSRSKKEISFLMKLFDKFLKSTCEVFIFMSSIKAVTDSSENPITFIPKVFNLSAKGNPIPPNPIIPQILFLSSIGLFNFCSLFDA